MAKRISQILFIGMFIIAAIFPLKGEATDPSEHYVYSEDMNDNGIIDLWAFDMDLDETPETFIYDTDENGRADHEVWTDEEGKVTDRFWDTNGDGQWDVKENDRDKNGKIDVRAWDSDYNGAWDIVEYDLNEDGQIDLRQWDIDGDGAFEIVQDNRDDADSFTE